MDNQVATIKPYDPTIRERLSEGLQAGLEKLGVGRYKARRGAQSITGGPSSNLPGGFGVADVVPFLGTAMATQEGVRNIGEAVEAGDAVGAGVEGAFAALGLIPGAASTIKAAKAMTAPKRLDVRPSTAKTKKESRYETAQEGSFYRVKPRAAKAAGPKDRGVREEVRQADTAGGPSGGDVSQPISDEAISLLIRDPSNFVYKTADDYNLRTNGEGYDLPQMPLSSLAKQSAIGRAFMAADEGEDAYKKAVFEAYGQRYPELIESTGAKDYDQLVEMAYRQLNKETLDQFHTLPVNMSFHRAGEGNYQSSGEMLRDIYGNRHLYVFQGGEPHPMMNRVDPETGLNDTEMFRAVHDFYGHAVHGNPFGPKGEEIAFGAHSRMYSPLARIAMATETRGQNSFVNYTPANAQLKQRINRLNEARYEANRRGEKADVAEIDKLLSEAWQDFRFGPQRSVLLPPEMIDLSYSGGMPDYIQTVIRPDPSTTASSMLTHFSHSPDIQLLDPSRYGTGIKGREMERLMNTQNPVMQRSYAYTGDPSMVRPEPGLGRHRYGATSQSLYDLSADPLMLRTLAAEANRTPWTAKYNPGVANPDQAFTDVERMAKEYGFEGLMNPQQGTAIMYNPTPVQPFQAGGAVKSKLKQVIKGAFDTLPPAESEANKAKFLADSAVQQRMYTGTSKDKDFSKFSVPRNGAWFTPSTDVASSYAKENDSKNIVYDADTRRFKDVNTADRVMPVYLKATKPYQITSDDIKRMNVGNYKKAQSQFFDSLRAQGHDSAMFEDGTTVILGGPNQIKSAIGNRGTYDTSQPDMNKAKGGAVKGGVKSAVKGALEMVEPMVNRLSMSFKDVTKRVPELTEAAKMVERGEMSPAEYDALVNRYKPVSPYRFVPAPATTEDAMRALDENKRTMFGKASEMSPGERADLRLDIPAYKNHGVWVNSIHRKGAPTVYGSVSSVRNATMIGSPDKAMKVATGETPKAPFAVIRGEWNPMSDTQAVKSAKQYLDHPEWRQVGYDPERHGYFYDRATMEPILGAEEVIQIGPLVLARKPNYGKKSEQKYQAGGLSRAHRRA